jgi:protein ImuA
VVDGHVLRVAARLGLCPEDDVAGGAREAVMDAAPDAWTSDDFVELHAHMKRLGQVVCRPSQPNCPACPVSDLCRLPAGPVERGDPPPPEAAKPGLWPDMAAAANENESRNALDAYLRRRIARLERMGVSPVVLAAAGVSLRREIDEAFLDRRLPAGAHQSAGARMEDGASALAPALAGITLLPPRDGLRALVVQEADARAEHGELHGPGLEAWGLNPREAAFVRARDGPQALEVADEALRSRAAPAVLLELRRGAHLADLSVTRRFNLQARRSGLFLFLVTPDLGGTSAATTRWRVAAQASAAPRRRVGPPTFRLDLVRNRAGRTGSWIVTWSAHERRLLSARAVAPESGGEDGLDEVRAGHGAGAVNAAVPASLAAAALHRSRAARSA